MATTAAPASASMNASAVSQDDKTMALLAHLLGIFTSFIGPLVLWIVKKDQSPFVERHAREALNFAITVILAYIVSAILILVLIGFLLIWAVSIAALIFGILATIQASKGNEYRYPVAIRFIKGPAGSA